MCSSELPLTTCSPFICSPVDVAQGTAAASALCRSEVRMALHPLQFLCIDWLDAGAWTALHPAPNTAKRTPR